MRLGEIYKRALKKVKNKYQITKKHTDYIVEAEEICGFLNEQT